MRQFTDLRFGRASNWSPTALPVPPAAASCVVVFCRWRPPLGAAAAVDRGGGALPLRLDGLPRPGRRLPHR